MNDDIKILLVEDDRDVRLAFRRALERATFHVITAEDKLTAITAIHNEKPDVMILDLALPNGDGRELIDHWNRNPERGPVAVTSGFLRHHESTELLADVTNVLEKPFDTDILIGKCREYAHIIRGRRCCKQVGKLRRQVMYQWLAIALLGGTQFISPLLQDLAKSLFP